MPLPAVNCVAVDDEVVDSRQASERGMLTLVRWRQKEGHFRRRLSWGMWRAMVPRSGGGIDSGSDM